MIPVMKDFNPVAGMIPPQFAPMVVMAFALVAPRVGATETQIEALKEQIAAVEAKIADFGPDGAEVAKLRENIQSAEAEIAKVKETLAQKEEGIATKEILLPVYQGAFRVVTKFSQGESIGAFTQRNGIPIDASNFVGVVKGGIMLQSATGSRTVPLDQLPDSFADRVLLPPPSVPIPGDLATIKSSKPEFLKSVQEKAAARAAGKEMTSKAAAPAPSAASAGSPATPTDPATEFEGIRKRNEARQREVAELKLQFSTLFNQKKQARDAKAADEQMFRSAKIKKSQTEVNSTMRMHDDKIRSIEQQETALREKIARLQLEME